MKGIEPRQVREHLDKVTSSALFAESERLRRFLRFTVESKLQGHHERVKEYVLGREVFDRPDDYDPRLDPIVRVEARRLRSKLAEYYGGPGRDESIRVEYPKGTYLPEIRRAQSGQAAAARSFRPVALAFAVLVVASLIALAFSAYRVMTRASSAAMIAVVPAQWLWKNQPGVDAAAIGLSETIAVQLANEHAARVVAWPLVVQGHDPGEPLRNVAKSLGASKFIVPMTRREDGFEVVNVFVIDPFTGEKVRGLHYVFDELPAYMDHVVAQRAIRDLKSSGALR